MTILLLLLKNISQYSCYRMDMLAFLLLTNDYATITLLRKIQANIHIYRTYAGILLSFLGYLGTPNKKVGRTCFKVSTKVP